MVFIVGCNIITGESKLYNSKTNKNKSLLLNPLEPNDVDLIEMFLKEMRIEINGRIDYLCVLMDFNYKNDFRQKFIEFVNCQNHIKNVRFVNMKQTFLYGAVKKLSFIPEIGDLLWIFDIEEKDIKFYSWKHIAEKQWKFQDWWEVEKTFKSWEKSPTIEDLQKIKSMLKANSNVPYICVFHGGTLNIKDFKSVFPEYQKIKFLYDDDYSEWLLNYARYLKGEKEYLKFKSETIFGRYLNIETSNDTWFIISGKQTLPLSKSLTYSCRENDILNVYENNVKTKTIPLERKNLSITLFIDINGIYYIEIIYFDKTIDEKEAKFYFFPKKLPSYTSELNAIGIDHETTECHIPIKFEKYEPTINAIGIDFGTTECCAAVIRKNGPDFVVLDDLTNFRTLPSYVAFDEENVKCGQIVLNRLRNKSEFTVYDAKRIIGRDFDDVVVDPLWPFKVLETSKTVLLETQTFDGRKVKSPEEVSAALLKHIKMKIETYQSEILSEAVITIPSLFSETQKQATKKVAEMAGWETIHFLPEPVAAAFAYFTETDIPSDSSILIFDCGGGTVDVCVAIVSNKTLKILSNDGDSYLGGRDFDKLLFNYFDTILKHKYNIDVKESNKKYFLSQKCHDIKHNLSMMSEDLLNIDDFNCDSNDVIVIKRDQFEEIASPLLLKIQHVILQALTKAQLEKHQIDYIFQVGGSCRMPMIKNLLKEIFPHADHQCSLYPDWVVAHGAALYSYHLKTTTI